MNMNVRALMNKEIPNRKQLLGYFNVINQAVADLVDSLRVEESKIVQVSDIGINVQQFCLISYVYPFF